MDFTVEPWAPGYGTPAPDDLEASGAQVDVGVELPAGAWRPVAPVGPRAETVAFVDGVRRVDAQVWVAGGDGQARLGVCASCAAGIVSCDGGARGEGGRRGEGTATVERVEVRREVLCPVGGLRPIRARQVTYHPRVCPAGSAAGLGLAVQQRMRQLEIGVTSRAPSVDLLVIDGPLRGRQDLPGAVGLVKAHQVAYLPPVAADVVGRLDAGERTPLFLMATSWTRLSWYVRLPGAGGHGWAGVVRVEASADLPVSEARRLADLTAVTLPAFASAAHKDPRAPANLYPIGGLERVLRRRLGDPALLLRCLQAAAAPQSKDLHPKYSVTRAGSSR
ncbi:MAG: hypothetical protein ACRD0K_28560 [Egibacteraceae bacterium]